MSQCTSVAHTRRPQKLGAPTIAEARAARALGKSLTLELSAFAWGEPVA